MTNNCQYVNNRKIRYQKLRSAEKYADALISDQKILATKTTITTLAKTG